MSSAVASSSSPVDAADSYRVDTAAVAVDPVGFSLLQSDSSALPSILALLSLKDRIQSAVAVSRLWKHAALSAQAWRHSHVAFSATFLPTHIPSALRSSIRSVSLSCDCLSRCPGERSSLHEFVRLERIEFSFLYDEVLDPTGANNWKTLESAMSDTPPPPIPVDAAEQPELVEHENREQDLRTLATIKSLVVRYMKPPHEKWLNLLAHPRYSSLTALRIDSSSFPIFSTFSSLPHLQRLQFQSNDSIASPSFSDVVASLPRGLTALHCGDCWPEATVLEFPVGLRELTLVLRSVLPMCNKSISESFSRLQQLQTIMFFLPSKTVDTGPTRPKAQSHFHDLPLADQARFYRTVFSTLKSLPRLTLASIACPPNERPGSDQSPLVEAMTEFVSGATGFRTEDLQITRCRIRSKYDRDRKDMNPERGEEDADNHQREWDSSKFTRNLGQDGRIDAVDAATSPDQVMLERKTGSSTPPPPPHHLFFLPIASLLGLRRLTLQRVVLSVEFVTALLTLPSNSLVQLQLDSVNTARESLARPPGDPLGSLWGFLVEQSKSLDDLSLKFDVDSLVYPVSQNADQPASIAFATLFRLRKLELRSASPCLGSATAKSLARLPLLTKLDIDDFGMLSKQAVLEFFADPPPPSLDLLHLRFQSNYFFPNESRTQQVDHLTKSVARMLVELQQQAAAPRFEVKVQGQPLQQFLRHIEQSADKKSPRTEVDAPGKSCCVTM